MQAIRTHNHGVSADDYGRILDVARHLATRHRPDVRVTAVERRGSRWYAITSAGALSFDELKQSGVTLTGSHDYAR